MALNLYSLCTGCACVGGAVGRGRLVLKSLLCCRHPFFLFFLLLSSPAGWSRQVQVEAFVVNIKDAAAPDVEGIVNPLLNRYNAGGCHYSVFALPAVQVRRLQQHSAHSLHFASSRCCP